MRKQKAEIIEIIAPSVGESTPPFCWVIFSSAGPHPVDGEIEVYLWESPRTSFDAETVSNYFHHRQLTMI